MRFPILGRGLVFKGDWQTDTEYQKNEVVSFQGSSYVSLVNNNKQTTDKGTWAKLTEKGSIGEKGWTPILGYQEISSIKIVAKLLDYEGGEGDKPTEHIGYYIGENGYTEDQNLATNFKSNTNSSPLIGAFTSPINEHEIGSNVNVNLTWSYSKDITQQSLNQAIGVLDKGVRQYLYPDLISFNTIFTMHASNGVSSTSFSRSHMFYEAIFYGSSYSVPVNSSQARLLNKVLRNNYTRFNLETGVENKIFIIIIPKENEIVSIKDGLIDITSNFTLIDNNFQIIDPSGVVRPHKLYKYEIEQPYNENRVFKVLV